VNTLWPIVVMALLLVSPSATAQQANVDTLSEFRKLILERLPPPGGGSFRQSLTQLFGLSGEVKVVTAAEMVFPDQHRISLTFATNSADVFLSESRPAAGGLVMTVFHTDTAFSLRGAASGATADSLRLIDSDSVATNFKELTALWDRHLPNMLERQRASLTPQ